MQDLPLETATYADLYFPFLSLALSRYQPYADDSCHLSEIVRCDFMQIYPDRSISFQYGGTSNTLTITATAVKKENEKVRSEIYCWIIERNVQLGVNKEYLFDGNDLAPEKAKWAEMIEGQFVLEFSKETTPRTMVIREYETFDNTPDGHDLTDETARYTRRILYTHVIKV